MNETVIWFILEVLFIPVIAYLAHRHFANMEERKQKLIQLLLKLKKEKENH